MKSILGFFMLFSVFCLVKSAKIHALNFQDKIVNVTCLAEHTDYACLRIFTPHGTIDPNFAENVKILEEAKMNWVPWFAPCPKCGLPRKQAEQIIAALNGRKGFITIFVHPEGWSDDIQANRDFISEIVMTFKEDPDYTVEIVTHPSFHTKVFGHDWAGLQNTVPVLIGMDTVFS